MNQINITPPTAADLEQVHRLNYQTFVEEIPQHPANDTCRLVDRFMVVSNWLVAKRGARICGMVCYNLNRPFSIDGKVHDLESFLPPHQMLAEVRLLAVEPAERRKLVTHRLLKGLCAELIARQVDTVVISGTTRQLALYKKIGFTAFGPLTGTSEASFQPMFITVNDLRDDFKTN